LKWSKYYFNILWFIGLVILLLIRFHYEQIILQTANETFNPVPAFWFGAFIPIVMGLYFGLIFIKGKTLGVNKSLLLCVVLPCFEELEYSNSTFIKIGCTLDIWFGSV
jgi:hypothetical protein